MASTNKTTHYELSQYIGTDKPTYLGDYNGDMAKIDAQMYLNATNAQLGITNASNAQSTADTASGLATTAKNTADGADTRSTQNATNIGSMADLTTSVKTNLVSAINEVVTDVANNTSNISDIKAINDASLLFDDSIKITVTPSQGSAYAPAGGVYYYKIGTTVHVNVALSGLSANQTANVFTLPVGYRPNHGLNYDGVGGSLSEISECEISTNGLVQVRSQGVFAHVILSFEARQ